MSLRVTLGLSLVALLSLSLATPARPAGSPEKTIERVLAENGPALVEALQRRGYGNVGVLKFLVSVGGAKPSDSVGTLNTLLAKQMEIALLKSKKAKHTKLDLIRNASAVANNTPDASYRNAKGRNALFGAKYPLYVGKRSVPADAFVTGLAAVDKDLSKMTVFLYLVDGKRKELTRRGVEDFALVSKMDPSKLSAAGESFILRGLFDKGKTDAGASEEKLQVKAVAAALKARDDKEEHPYFEKNKPVTLQVCYDGKPAEVIFKDGKARIPSPKVGQHVELRLTRDNSQETYGVVLKVNGENTIAKQKLQDSQCRRWILEPSRKVLTIDGYQKDDKTYEPFEVKTAEESKKMAMDFGDQAGMITMTVFRKRQGKAPPKDPLDRYASAEEAIKGADLPKEAGTYRDVLNQMEDEVKTRSLDSLFAGSGKTKGRSVKKVTFDADPTPILSETIIYYTP
jgi:hypothetical protein